MNREVCGICWCPYDDNGACGCKTLDDAMQQPRAMARADHGVGYTGGHLLPFIAAAAAGMIFSAERPIT